MIGRGIVKAYQSKPRRSSWRIAHMTVGCGTVEPELGRLTQHLKRDRPKVLIDQLILEELSIQTRSAFAEQTANAIFLSEQLRGHDKIDPGGGGYWFSSLERLLAAIR